ncbi:hypothetical protein G6F22_018055 [Rhizopus arrhizus]|nr:hypothetical protein G6F22_018055 [Rhizopus arrhizus]
MPRRSETGPWPGIRHRYQHRCAGHRSRPRPPRPSRRTAATGARRSGARGRRTAPACGSRTGPGDHRWPGAVPPTR